MPAIPTAVITTVASSGNSRRAGQATAGRTESMPPIVAAAASWPVACCYDAGIMDWIVAAVIFIFIVAVLVVLWRREHR